MSDAVDFSYDIAVIGLGVRFPGARNVEEFWQNLQAGVESITFFSDEELLDAGVDQATLSAPGCVKAGAVLEDVDQFDAAFFGYTAREAEMMDPQHRLFLEEAWRALETTGYDSEKFKGRIGVYAGESVSSYLLHHILPHPELIESVGHFQTLLSNDRDHLVTGVAYKLNLKGPCVTVQSSCSTSLVAVHLACQSLLNRECDMALAGGVSVSLPQKQALVYQEGGIISPDGHCRAFDAKAAGTVKGSGVGIVVLKRLADALADGDRIEAVIKGSAINNDGSAKAGYTAPSVEGQASVIEEAMAMAGVEPETISYIEAHGTGTALGDPIEIGALAQTFRAGGATAKNFCAIGSVKTNIGHLDAAAGVAGLIKTVLALKHKRLPASLHYAQPNPNIDFSNSPFFVNEELSVWDTNGIPRRAGVSSFGIGGTNAHVILEESPAVEPSGPSRPHQLLILSAKTDTALEDATRNLAVYLGQHPQINLADVASTLQLGRREFDRRVAIVCRDVDDAVSTLKSLDLNHARTNVAGQLHRPVVFMFPGQGAQHAGMARELYHTERAFREEFSRCSELLAPQLKLDLRDLLFSTAAAPLKEAEGIDQTRLAQPALFALEYSLAKLWMAWGVRPQAMLGHSLGDYTAACLAGVFSLEDALSLVAERGRLMQQMPAGAMLSVPLSEAEIEPFLDQHLSLAAVNGLRLCTLSGTLEAIARLEQKLAAGGLTSRRLRTSHAYHSMMMEPVLDPFNEVLKEIDLRPPQIPFISSLTGSWITAEEATNPRYWSRQLREPVRFAEGLAELAREPEHILLEVGPGKTLSTLAHGQRDGTAAGPLVLSSMPHAQDRVAETAYLLKTLGQLWAARVEIDWHAFSSPERRHRVQLPAYPFERKRYWIEPRQGSGAPPAQPDDVSRRPDLADWFYLPSWKRSVVPHGVARMASAAPASVCIILMDQCGLGSLLLERLRSEGQSVCAVRAGERFEKQSEEVFYINPQRREDYTSLLDALQESDRVPATILHLWNVTPERDAPLTLEILGASPERNFFSLLFLAQALGDSVTSSPVNILLVTNNLQDVTGEEIVQPEKATALGPCRVIPQEYANITCRCVDMVLPPPGTELDEELKKLADSLIAELYAASSEPLVAYRGRHRWVQTFEPLPLAMLARVPPEQTRLREGGVYLLTGGPGEIDLALARWLAERVRPRLILNIPAGFPAREEWKPWLVSHENENAVSRQIKEIQALEESGAEVMLSSADVADPEQMSSLIARARERFGEINGVFHTAAATGGGMVQFKTPEAAAKVLAPKVAGTLVLQSVLQEMALDFYLLFSSTLALTGVFGQVDYCAANAFQDAFAQANNSRRKVFTVAINWNLPRWEGWQDSTLAGTVDLRSQFEQARAAYGISLQEGLEAIGYILSSSQPQVIVSAQDFQALVEAQRDGATNNLLDQLKVTRSSTLAGGGGFAPPADEMERAVAQIWQELFGIEQVGAHESFFDLGGNSLLAIQLVSHLRKAFEVEFPLSRLFESPTIAGLAAVVNEVRRKRTDEEEIERLLREIEGLSPDELEAQLSEEFQSGDAGNLNG